MHSSDVAPQSARSASIAPSVRAGPPPPPTLATEPGAAQAPRRAADVIPAHLPRQPLPSLADLRAHHVIAAALALIVVVIAALILLPGRTTPTDDDATLQQPAVINPVPPPSPAPEEDPTGVAPGAPAAPGEDPDVPGGGIPSLTPAEDLLQRVNAQRDARGLSPLEPDPDLERVALEHVGEMIERRRLFHTPNRVLAQRVTNWQLLAESIGVGPTVPALMDAFLTSDVDRRNMLDEKLWHVGIAAVQQGRRLWVTMLFTDENDPGTSLPSTAG